jgi:hypothetical protein
VATRRLDHFKTQGQPVAHRSGGTYCGGCGLFLKTGRPKWLVAGTWYHHHCARYLDEPPPATVCKRPGCHNSTSVQFGEDGFEILPLCWLHRRPERVQQGLGLYGEIARKAEAIEQATKEYEAWCQERGFDP